MNTNYSIPIIYEDVKNRSKILCLKDNNYFSDKNRIILDTTYLLSEKIAEINKNFDLSVEINTKATSILNIMKSNENISDVVSTSLFKRKIINSKHIILEAELLPFKNDSIDLFYSVFGLDYINDLPGTLKQIHYALKKGGMFIAAFLGEGTLKPLSEAFMHADEKVLGGIHPRIHPFFEIKTLANLFQRIGFRDIVADQEKMIKKYSNLNELFEDIRSFGTTNILVDRRKKFTPSLVFKIIEDMLKKNSSNNSFFIMPCNIIFICCWKSDA